MPFAETQVSFVVNRELPGIKEITVEQLLKIYNGEIDNWKQLGGPDHKIFPITRDGGTTLKTVLKHVPGFQKKARAAKATFSSLETMRLLEKHPYTIGFVPSTLIVGTSLIPVPVVGENTSELKLPLKLGIVHQGPVKGCAAEFVNFLSEQAAHKIIRANRSRPLT